MSEGSFLNFILSTGCAESIPEKIIRKKNIVSRDFSFLCFYFSLCFLEVRFPSTPEEQVPG